MNVSAREQEIINNPSLAVQVKVNGEFYPILSLENETMRVYIRGAIETFRDGVCVTNPCYHMEPGRFVEIDS